MDNGQIYKGVTRFIRIDDGRCNGCVLCMKACPAKAIRVKEGKARIIGTCIDCGECIRACPRGAIEAVITGQYTSKIKQYTILSVSPVLYTQFGEDFRPNDVLLALRKVFKYVYDQAYIHELFNVATELYIHERRGKEGETWPLISPICPVVNRLIACRFPSLLKNILPVIPPREIAARALKRRLHCESGFKMEDFGIYYVSPCSAKVISVKDPLLMEASYLDGAMGINEVYEGVKRYLGKVNDTVMLHRSSGVGILWGMSGGEIGALDTGEYLAVSGIPETIQYLEKIEMGLLDNMEYVEFRACSEGCIGGPMTAMDKYQAKHILQRLVRMFGVEKRLPYSQARRAYEDGWLFTKNKKTTSPYFSKDLSISEGIKRQAKVEEIYRLLPEKECGICGSPDCRTFAEDVVDGRTSLNNCPWHSGNEGKGVARNEG